MATKVLFIDDEKSLTDLAQAYLRHYGFDVSACNEPESALDVLEGEVFDAVFVDLMMFPMNGLTILRKLRANPKYANLPLFVLSAKMLTDEERKELLTLKIAFMPKPFAPRELLRIIREKVATP